MNRTPSSLTITRKLKASPAKVFAAITQPDQILQWWGPDAGPALSAEADLRPGGRFSIVFRMLDGSEHNPTGAYVEVVPDSKLVFTWEWPGRPEWESRVTFLLRQIDTGTELTLIHEQLPSAWATDAHNAGWMGWLDELQAFLGETQ